MLHDLEFARKKEIIRSFRASIYEAFNHELCTAGG
jgi:hypothetical protein